jgi:hypothetical protein
VPRFRDDCHSTLNVFCSVADLKDYALKNNFDLKLLRCGRIEVRSLDIDSPNCRYTINEERLTLNRSFGGLFQPPERLPDPASVRQALRAIVWGENDPLIRPGSLVNEWQNVLPPTQGLVTIPDSLASLATAEDSVHHAPLLRSMVMRVHGSVLSRLSWFAFPDHIPGRYAVYNEGHGTSGIAGAAPMIDWLLAAGWQVLVLDMPLDGLNIADAHYPVFDHNDMDFVAREEGVSALRWFFLPIAGAVDLVFDDAHTRATGVDLLMIGRSGGGWASMLYSAMDPRVDVAANISGGAPLSTFLDSTLFRRLGSHYENETATLYDQVSEMDFLLAAGTRGNFHFFSTHDPCCYWFTPSHPYIRFLDSLKARNGKKYRVFVDGQNTIHGLGPRGLEMLGSYLAEVGLRSKPNPTVAAAIALQARDSLTARSRPPAARPSADSLKATRDSTRAPRP